MTDCTECGLDLSSHPDVGLCPNCGSCYHITQGGYYRVPQLDGETLIAWNGHSVNFLDLLDKSPTPGFIRTRRSVAELLVSVGGRYPKKQRRMDYLLDEYGLEFTPFDPQGRFNITAKIGKPTSNDPGTLSRKGETRGQLPPLEPTSVQQQPSPTLSQSNADWVLERISEMYPNQTLHDEQKQAIESVLGRPGGLTSCVLPTGFGKSRIAQAAAISKARVGATSGGLTLIVAPTISLIDDQRREWEDELNRVITDRNSRDPSGTPMDELRVLFMTRAYRDRTGFTHDDVLRMLLQGELDVLCCSPEDLSSTGPGLRLLDIAPQLGRGRGRQFANFIIDEAHIVFDWGDSIRESFLLLFQAERTLRRLNPSLHTVLMTATLAPREEEWLINRLGRDTSSRGVKRIRKDTVREDLAYTVQRTKPGALLSTGADLMRSEYAANRLKWRSSSAYASDSPLLIYTRTPDQAETISDLLPFNRKRTYHGNTGSKRRVETQRLFFSNQIDSLVGTSAFGMGVNKSDVWLTGYIGAPYTLREVYQMFGRTARGSGWPPARLQTLHNGNCIAFMPEGAGPFAYNPTFKPPKAVERVWTTLSMGHVTDNGYACFSLRGLDHIFWEPDPYEAWLRKKQVTFTQRIQKRFKTLVSKGHSQQAANNDNVDYLRRQWDNYLFRRNGEEIGHKLKALVLLETAGFIEILGLHPLHPTSIGGKAGPTLPELLEQGGYGAVLDHMGRAGTNGVGLRTASTARYVVTRVIKPIDGRQEIMDALEEGLKIMEHWHEQNAQELLQFLRGEECLRKHFAPVTGAAPADIDSCIQTYTNNLSSALPGNEPPVSPCSVCRVKARGVLPDDIADLIHYDPAEPAIWMTPDIIEALAGRGTVATTPINRTIFGGVSDLPLVGFLCGWPYNSMHQTQEIKQRVVEEVNDIVGLSEIRKGHYQFEYRVIDDQGGTVGPETASCEIFGSLRGQFRVMSLSIQPKTGYGLLFYWVNDNLYARDVHKDDSKDAYRALRGQQTDSDWEPNFIGSVPPPDGTQTRSWNAL